MESPILPHHIRKLVFLWQSQLGLMQGQFSATLAHTQGPEFVAPVSLEMGLNELKHCANEFERYPTKSAPMANPSFVERCLQLFLEDVFCHHSICPLLCLELAGLGSS